MVRFAIITTVLAALAAASAVAQTAGDPRFAAFVDDCATTLSDLAVTKQRVESAGWKAVEPSSHPELQAVYELSQAGMKTLPGVTLQSYSRTINGRLIYMMISGNVPAAGMKANGCYLYDFEDKIFAADVDPNREIESWMGVAPTESINQVGQISQKKWIGPTAHPQFATVRMASIPTGSAVATAAKFSGRAWAATAFAK